jgi:2-phosphoglycerate kinase
MLARPRRALLDLRASLPGLDWCAASSACADCTHSFAVISRVAGMRGVRVVLIGGTSNVGKSTVARAVADSLGFECLSTDALARHPGRPWRTPGREVPTHVAEHYRSLTVDELITSVLDHYVRLWPRIEELITSRTTTSGAGATVAGLVLEGSALWPVRVAQLATPHTAAVWLTADETVLRARVHAAGRHDQASPEERALMDTFLSRTLRFQALMLEAVDRLDLDRIDTGSGRSVENLADAVLETVDRQHAVGRSPTR